MAEEKETKELMVEREVDLSKFDKPTEMLGLKVYLNLGEDRTIRRVNDIFQQRFSKDSVTLRTLFNWSIKNNWVDRADKFDQEQYEALMKLELKRAMKSKINMVTICRALLLRFGMRLKGEGDYKPNMKDAELAYKIMKQELGEGLPEWDKVREINLTAIFQQIFKNEKEEKDGKMDS